MRNKTTAALLALFLGGFGIHKFYLGRGVAGVVYLVFFWTLIPALAAFVDFILLLTMSERTFDTKFNDGAVARPQVIVNVAGGSAIGDRLIQLEQLRGRGEIEAGAYEREKARLLSDN